MSVRRHERCGIHQLRGRKASASKDDFPLKRLQSGQRAHQVLLPVARNTGDPDDLSPRDIEADILKTRAPDRPGLEIDVAHFGRLRRKGRPQASPYDHAQQVLVTQVAHRAAALHPAVTQHGDPMRDLPYFGQAVRDVDDRRSRLHLFADPREQKLGRILVQRGRRFVQDQKLWMRCQRLRDLQKLLLRDCQCVASCRKRDPQAHLAKDVTRDLSCARRLANIAAGSATRRFSMTDRSSRIDGC